jgi:carboxyl-terminal processing protease
MMKFLVSIFISVMFMPSLVVFANTINKSSNDHLPEIVSLTNKKWQDAFLEMNQLLKNEYALGEHKKIHWNQLSDKYSKFIEQAYKNKDKVAYYQALRNYMLELHDMHSFIFADQQNDPSTVQFISDLVKRYSVGSYGIIINKVNDGRYITSFVEPNTPAANAGIIPGSEILFWNNKPITQAVHDVDIVWNDENELISKGTSSTPSTQASLDYEKMRMLVRGEIGAHAQVVWKNPEENTSHEITLTAIDDHTYIAKKTALYQHIQPSDPSKQIIVNWLPDHYVQLILGLNDGEYCDPSKNEKESPLYSYFIKTMQGIIQQNPKGIIIDLRGNPGGDGRLAMDYAGYFTENAQSLFSVRMTFYNTVTKNYQPISGAGPYYIQGKTPYYHGPTVVLTDIATISGGEWAALSFQKIGKPILSFYPNTQGAFAGSVGQPLIVMPENFIINFSDGIAYDENHQVLVESNAELKGGVQTDILIPFDTKTAIDINTNNKDVALDFALSYLKISIK